MKIRKEILSYLLSPKPISKKWKNPPRKIPFQNQKKEKTPFECLQKNQKSKKSPVCYLSQLFFFLENQNPKKISSSNPEKKIPLARQYCDWAYIAPRLTSLIIINGHDLSSTDNSSPFQNPIEILSFNKTELCICARV